MSSDEIIEAEFEEVADATSPESLALGRAIVTVARRPHAKGLGYSYRADASFMAQLIAAAANAPQTRTLRRASPEDALASYRDTTEREQATPVAGKTTLKVV
jgi:hypothetical protein